MLGNTLVTAQTGPAGRKVQTDLLHGRQRHQEGVLPGDPARPGLVPAGDRRLHRGRRRDREGRPRDSREDLQGLRRSGLRAGRLPGPGAHLPARLQPGGGEERAKADPSLFRMYWETDASMVEINPLDHDSGRRGPGPRRQGLVRRQRAFRHPEILALRDLNEEDPKEIEASKHALNYIALDGNIACLVNGAGLAMSTMDIIKHFGGNPGQLPRRGRRRDAGAGRRGLQDHPGRPEREGNPRQHLRRHHGLQRDRHRHRRGRPRGWASSCRWSSVSRATTSSPARRPLRRAA